jgi:antitoxin component of MazEF toxin-antitoxin module
LKPTEIDVAGEKLAITPGAKRGQDLMDLAQIVAPEQIVLEVEDDVDIAISATDVIIIRGKERFSIGSGHPQLPDNPVLRNPIGAMLNDQPLGHGRHGKATVAELVAWSGGGHQDVWVDLDGLADALLEPGDRIVIQKKDHFITVPRDEHDQLYEVTVLFDGEDKKRRFPPSMTVLQAMRRSLPPRDRQQISEFQMADRQLGPDALDVNLTLKAAGVRDGHVLSITKKNGGGG